MRDAIVALGGDPDRVNPLQPVELVIDHSVQVDYFARPTRLRSTRSSSSPATASAMRTLRWGQRSFNNFQVVPPDTGIVHQVNIEYLARVVFSQTFGGTTVAYPDTLVGTDSHTTMVNVARSRRVGRRRHRGGSRHARPADLDVDPAGRRLPADRSDASGRDRDRPGADDHRDIAQAWRRRQVRRVLRRRAWTR